MKGLGRRLNILVYPGFCSPPPGTYPASQISPPHPLEAHFQISEMVTCIFLSFENVSADFKNLTSLTKKHLLQLKLSLSSFHLSLLMQSAGKGRKFSYHNPITPSKKNKIKKDMRAR